MKVTTYLGTEKNPKFIQTFLKQASFLRPKFHQAHEFPLLYMCRIKLNIETLLLLFCRL